jgi:ABC-2 type transport system permease protein
MLVYLDLEQLNSTFASASQAALLDLFGTTDYFSYMAAGMTTIIVLFTVMFAGVSIVWERRFGFLNKLLVSPIPRSSIILSKIFGGVFRAMFQAAVVLLIAVVLGMQVTPDLSVIDVLVVFAALALLSFGLSSLFIAIATMITKQETLMAAINLLNLPLLFASNALFPIKQMPDWLQGFASINPISYAADAVRGPLLGTATAESLAVDFTALAIFAMVFTTVGILMARYGLTK